MKLFSLFKMNFPKKFEIKKGLEILGIEIEEEYQEQILNEISNYLFKKQSSIGGGEKVFDYAEDYKYYYVDFLEVGQGIDLNKQDISWWEFDSILEGILLKENSIIGQVISYRTYKKPSKNSKTNEEIENNYYMSKKRQYALKNRYNKNDTEENIRLMMSRAKETSKNQSERSDDLSTMQK